ncbi:MAG TPA: DUF1294 domain-containing protein [Lacunisphaera sp.]|nr:DUF1294 domain-containing protein [Lacunisphaera sp.]
MNLSGGQLLLAGWLGLSSLAAFVLFGFDKWQAGRKEGRIPESMLWWVCAAGGWPGGLLGMGIFRHKSAKAAFLFKFGAAFGVWLVLLWTAWRLGGFR